MRLGLLTVFIMVGFAANSVLNRLALTNTGLGPGAFALIRLASGAAILMILVRLRPVQNGKPLRSRWLGAAALALYVLGFSFAYVSLDAGIGALLLFGGLQITMFIGALILREPVPPARWTGAVVAFAGLVWLMWPGSAVAPDLGGAALMIAAAIGWGVYSLLGRSSTAPLADTAWSFTLALPAGIVAALMLPAPLDTTGVVLAVLSGAVTSALSYAAWYAVLPALGASRAAVAQLTVPVIAMLGGMIFLAEPFTARFAVATLLVLGGVALSLSGRRPR